jgi:hypothetical protein
VRTYDARCRWFPLPVVMFATIRIGLDCHAGGSHNWFSECTGCERHSASSDLRKWLVLSFRNT